MQIVSAAVAELIPYQLNNRIHSSDQVSRIASSIKEFGFNQPIVIDDSKVVLVGHGRLEAAKLLKMETVPVIVLANLDETQKKSYRILDNKIQNDSEWNFANLEIELASIANTDFAFQSFGLDELLGLSKKENNKKLKIVEDDAPAPPAQTLIKSGDVITLGRHRLVCGDSTNSDAVALLIQPGKIDLIVTDPPYGLAYVGGTDEKLKIDNDDLNEKDLEEFWEKTLNVWLPHLKEGGGFYASVPAGTLNLIFANALKKRDMLRQQLVWNKDQMVLSRKDYHYKHEAILYGWKPGAAHYFTDDRTQTTVIDCARPKRNEAHPTMKPLELFGKLISNSSRVDDVVGDAFLGSGSTLIACEQLDRTCRGMELKPEYCHVIVSRYAAERKRSEKELDIKINGVPFPEEWISKQ